MKLLTVPIKSKLCWCFRWVSEDLVANEEFFGLYLTDSITSAALVAIIEDTLSRMNIKLEHCRVQCYDGASAMTGARNGVAKTISDKESRAIFTRCYGHALNLGVGDTVKQCQLMKSSLDVVIEISKLIKKSPKRDAIFQKLKSDLAPDTPGFCVLCPTRWTVCAASLQSVLDNYQVLFEVWYRYRIGADITCIGHYRYRIDENNRLLIIIIYYYYYYY